MEFGAKESDLQDIYMFNSVFRILLVEPWSEESNSSLLTLLPLSLQVSFKEDVLKTFKRNVSDSSSSSINFTLLLFSEIYKL